MGLRGAPSEGRGETIWGEPYVARRHIRRHPNSAPGTHRAFLRFLAGTIPALPHCGRVFRTPPRRHSMAPAMTPRRQGQTPKPNVPKKGQARGGGYGRGLASQTHATCDRARTHAALEYWQWGGRILVDPFAARAPHQLIDGAATHSTLITTQQQYSQSGLRRLPLTEAGQQNKSVGFDLFSSMMQRCEQTECEAGCILSVV